MIYRTRKVGLGCNILSALSGSGLWLDKASRIVNRQLGGAAVNYKSSCRVNSGPGDATFLMCIVAALIDYRAVGMTRRRVVVGRRVLIPNCSRRLFRNHC
jgi:hypothetical protein